MDTSLQPRAKVTPKDFFLWLGGMAALYVSAVSLITLWFQYIDYLFPDGLQGYYDPFSSQIRFAMASLIIIFPLYLFLTRVLNQDLRRNPAKRELWIRRWLIYLTLFVAGITMVVDLIILINTFLGGDITTRFVLKVLAVLAVIGPGFYYYLADLKGKWERAEGTSKLIGGAVALVVLLSIVGGFLITGSPMTQRLIRFDQEKVADLQNIQWHVVNYWQQKERLPQSLKDLEDPITGFVVPVDPQSGESYRFRVISARTFELCAVFNKESVEIGAPQVARPVALDGELYGLENENWRHGVGLSCFERTIDPDRFPPFKN